MSNFPLSARRISRLSVVGRVLLGAAVALLFAPPTRVALAQPRGDDLKFDVETLSIRATRSNDEVSPKLRDLAEKLRQEFRFTGYRVEKDSNCKVDEAGENCKHDLGSKYEIRVQYQGVNEQGKVKLEIVVLHRDDKKLSSTVAITPGKTALFGGWDLPGGDKLIVAITPTRRD
ncbi:MAG: hypothetical protein SF069_15020 [Phycisphaerae bacterium]|nr:hypothetical protein [Phycisphaerae bacterium]